MRPLVLLLVCAACDGGTDGKPDDTDATRPTIEGRDVTTVLGSGSEHSCLVVDGEARCWGHNGLGEAVSNVGPFVRVSVGSQFNCGVSASGAATCWGVAGDERLIVPTGVTFLDLDVGTAHGCGLDSTGAVRCWGRAASTALRPPEGTYLDLDSGNDVSCAVDTTGKPTCWGTTDALSSDVPDGAYNLVRVGTTEACALSPDGALACWGGGSVTFDAPNAGAFSDVAVGDSAACAIAKADGSLICWGGAGAGFGAEVVADVPTGVFSAVSVGTGHACALSNSGPVCWGADTYGAATVPAPGFTGVVAATGSACGVSSDTTLSCFGLHGAFATLDGKKWRSVELHSADACAVSDAGEAVCGLGNARQFEFVGAGWSEAVDYGNVGFCGLNTLGAVSCFARNGTELPTLTGTYAHLATGQDGICGLATDGTVSCIGDANNSRPVETYTALAMGGFACVIGAGGALHCWGAGAPDGGPPDGDFSKVTVGGTFACALKTSDQSLVCWGDDDLVVPTGRAYQAIDADGGTVCATRDDGLVECFGDMTRVGLDGTIGGP